jgi:staphylococcal nuclease domain-containing protein 1
LAFHLLQCPNVRSDGARPGAGSAEAYGEEAKYFVESRLLQRDIKIVLETANNNNVVGSIIHPVRRSQGFLLCQILS